MANRHNHYEQAFEAVLRQRQVPYVAVNESRRNLLPGGESIKNLDFIVSSGGSISWLVDVKGRRFPSGEEQKHYWKNWSTEDDLAGLAHWESLFGPAFCGLFVFAYNVVGDRSPLPPELMFVHRERLYGFVGIPRLDYQRRAHPISSAWGTVAMSGAEFRRLARPVDDFFQLATNVA